ncbi:phosphotransferase [Actinomadura harenae]|uniref:Aminoglycoside phosphotransferase family protein n=1 Tax=Actinomadura harenae TaxID=2483351 RepID=A0A3M2LZ96_9ACTN|nr:phosphotransferase [Actinomadura harenae]RMI42801.1 aminoglycoside phosphotransferase family protein [Actinomadura harenae]
MTSPDGLDAALRAQIAQVDRRIVLSGGLDAHDRDQIRLAAALAGSLRRSLGLGRFGGVLTGNAARPQLVLGFSCAERGEVVLKVYGKQRAGEAQALRLWARHGVPVVPVLDGGDEPQTWLLMARVEGTLPSRDDLADDAALAALTRGLAAIMAAGHAVAEAQIVTGAGRTGIGAAGNGLPGGRPLGPTMTGYLEAAVAALTARGYEPPGRWREAASLYEAGPATLLHGDLGLGNVIRDRDGVLRLLDPSAYVGYAGFDAARWCARVAGPDRVETALAAWLEAEPAVNTSHTRALLGLELLLQGGVREAVKRQRGQHGSDRDLLTCTFLDRARHYLADS